MMSTIIIQCGILVVWIAGLNGDIYLDRPKIKSANGDLLIEPGFDKNIILLPNGPKSKIYIGGVDILKQKNKNSDINEISDSDIGSLVDGPNGILKRLETLETSRTPQLPNDVSVNVSLLWRKVNNLQRKVLLIQTQLSERTKDDCLSRPCKHGGTCLNLYNGYHCLCPSNWEGQDCEEDVNECRNFAGTDLGCQNGATCINKPGSYECFCKPKWFGTHCTRKEKDCSGGDFEMCGHGKCIPVQTGDGITCICDQGWTNNGTSVSCLTDVNECESKYGPRCSTNPRVECVNLPGSFMCGQCPPGYEGDGYTCSDINECLTIPNGGCNPMVTCHNTIGSRICSPCPTGYVGDGVTCTWRGSCNINHGGCHPSAQCIELETSVDGSQTSRCICPDGMVGDGIGLHGCYVTSGNNFTGNCDKNPCGIHGQCHVVRYGYTCICQRGYGGSNCNIPSNPCAVNPCHNNGICRPDDTLTRGFRCECTSQYSGQLCEALLRTCGGVLDNEEGSIVYPITNTTYSHNSRCAWVIHTVPGKVINVTFTKFNLESSTGCGNDFLQIHDGRSSASYMFGRFCGDTYPKGGNIISSDNNLYFWFRSDSTVAKTGFALHWTTIDPICGGYLNASEHGRFNSPGSPGKYPPNRDCYWHLSTRLGKRIQLHFFEMDLEIHRNCSFDYLAIYDGARESNSLLNKYCNSSQPAPVQSVGSNLLVHFHSDAFGSGNGFQIAYAPLEGVPGCGGYFTTDIGQISSPSYNEAYLTNMICDYKIRTSPGTKIYLDFKRFSLERSFRCKFDYLKIYDGSSPAAPLVGTFCGNTYPKSYLSTSNTLFFVFQSDATVSTEGFQITYRALCQTKFEGDSGVIKSPGYPFNYPNNKFCEYVIETTPGKAIVLSFQDFNLESYRRDICRFDYIEVRDGPDTNSTLIGKYCGNSIPPTLTSTLNNMYIKFRSDVTISGTGFYANYTTIDIECGGVYTKTTDLIKYPSEQSTNYKNDQTCTWLLNGPPGMHIQLNWHRFDIEYSQSCESDYLELTEIDSDNVNNTIGKFCGSRFPAALTITTNRLRIYFKSDSSVRSAGFSLSYTFLDEKSHCGGIMYKSRGSIYSPGWPNKYENNRDCKWTIIVPIGQLIRVNISQFDLERSIRGVCTFGDYLEFRNGNSESSSLIGQYCGSFNTKIITSFGHALFIHFHSDFYLTGKGFKLEWDANIIGCGGTMTSATGAISSPNYPEHYYENAECFYKIITSLGSRIQLSFVDLDLERTHACSDDYIEIFDGKDVDAPSFGKHCYMKNELNHIASSTNYVFIKFKSDFYSGGKGFLLNYYTNCSNTLTGRYGIIESPNFPNRYPEGLNCVWNIKVPIGNKINITFSHFDLKSRRAYWNLQKRTDECNFAYLQWKDSTDTKFDNKVCGDTLPHGFTSKSNNLEIHFVSGSPLGLINPSGGFRLEWVNYGCGGHIQKRYGSIDMGSELTSNKLECEWLVETPPGTSVNLVVSWLGSQLGNCTSDGLEIYNGQNTNSPLISKICNRDRSVIQSSSNYMLIKFSKMSALKGTSFQSTFSSTPATCGGNILAPSGYIYSKNYPKNYDDNLNCIWSITVPPNHRIELTFEDLDLYSASDEDDHECSDSIKIYNTQYLYNANYTDRICSNTKVSKIVSKRNKVIIQFTTNKFGNAKGFKIHYRAACGGEINSTINGIISNENYIFKTNESCLWTIIAPSLNQKISLTITHLDFPKWDQNSSLTQLVSRNNTPCPLTYLRVFDGNDINAPVLDEYCGHKAPPMIISHGNVMTVKLGTNGNKITGHFSAQYSVLSTACGGTLTSEEGSIVSPNYPRTYPANADCEWILSTSPGNKVALTFEQFALEDSEGCNEDYLEIRENYNAGPLLGVYCGSTIPINTTSAQKLYIKFHSNDKTNGQGFVLHYEFLHGNEITGFESGEIGSPLYPHSYSNTGEYSWRIYVEGANTITITVNELDIPAYSDVCQSKLAVYDGYDDTAPLIDGELCGILRDGKKVFQTSSNMAYIKLVIEDSSVLFHLRWSKTNHVEESDDGEVINCGSNTTILVAAGNATILKSPNYPEAYGDNLHCEWVYQASDGHHLALRFSDLDFEESRHCFNDYINIYSASIPGQWKPVMEHLCKHDQIMKTINASTYIKIVFKSDYSMAKKGFKCTIASLCGGYMADLSGDIYPSWIDMNTRFTALDPMTCVWTVRVRPGRVIELDFDHFNLTNTNNKCLTSVTLRNGESTESPLLASGKYCGEPHEILKDIETSSNALHITYSAKQFPVYRFNSFRIHYEEKNVECGVTSKLEMGHDSEIISSPKYPDPPTPYSECIWIFTGPPGEILQMDFLGRFDLDDVSDCATEVVEVRDGFSSIAPLIGRYCGETPGTLKSTSNALFIKYVTQLEVPRNGFRANISISICGGTIIANRGEIKSPGYPHYHIMPANSVCVWIVRATLPNVLNIYPQDIDLQGSDSSCTNKITIERKIPGNDSISVLKTFCKSEDQIDLIETFTNEVTIKFYIGLAGDRTNMDENEKRGFRFTFNTTRHGCGERVTTSEGYLTTPAYPLETNFRYCFWAIIVPDKTRRIHLEILDANLDKQMIRISDEPTFAYSITRFKSLSNNTQMTYDTSGHIMYLSIQVNSFFTKHKFKAKFTSNEQAICGGDLIGLEGEIISPDRDEAYSCEWKYNNRNIFYNNNITYDSVLVTVQLNSSVTNSVCRFYDPKLLIMATGNVNRGLDISRSICQNTESETNFRMPLYAVTFKASKSPTSQLHFTVKYKSQPCGGIVSIGEDPINILNIPTSYNETLDCAWIMTVPYSRKTQIQLQGLFTYDCDSQYIKITQGLGQNNPPLGTFCINRPLDTTLITSFHQIYVEYHSKPYNISNIQLIANTSTTQCGGNLQNFNHILASPNYPKNYNPNQECTWTISTNLGNRISLSFIGRFVIEDKPNCTKDALIVYDWKNDNYNEMARLCGRQTPIPLNSTHNKMKVVFRTDSTTNLEGFRAIWLPKCGGKYEATDKEQYLYSPGYPNHYNNMEKCVYEIVAPYDQTVHVKFLAFNLEGTYPDCKYDNLTIKANSDYDDLTKVYCGDEIPADVQRFNKVSLIFYTDEYVSRKGFKLSYSIYQCGGIVTEPSMLTPNSVDGSYDNNMNCIWFIRAPSNRTVVFKFIYIDVESTSECYADYVAVYDGTFIDDNNRIAMLCGHLNKSFTLRSVNNTAVLQFVSDHSYELTGFKVQVQFTYSESVGCGGHINLSTSNVQTLKSLLIGNNTVYENYLDCFWTITSPPDTTIKIEFESFHISPCINVNQTAIGYTKCDCDFVEIYDGINHDSLVIGTYCGHTLPPSLTSSHNLMGVRMSTDGEISSSGFEVKLSVHPSVCGKTHYVVTHNVQTFKSPSLPNGGIPRGLHCVYYFDMGEWRHADLRISIKQLDLKPEFGQVSKRCTQDKFVISETRYNSHNVSSSKNIITQYSSDSFVSTFAYLEDALPHSVEFCGSTKPSDLYFSGKHVAVTLMTSFEEESKLYKGVEFDFSFVDLCGRNYTDTQGKIMAAFNDEEETELENCFILITAPENHTISLYFISIRNDYYSDIWNLQIHDGKEANSPVLGTMTIDYEVEYPAFFSTGRYMLLRQQHGVHVEYDLNFMTTDKGPGCGGKLINELGRVTSQLYPYIYRHKATCEWELQTPLGTHLKLHFAVFDLGPSCDQNYVQLVNSKGDEISTYCSEKPADYISTDNYVKIVFYTTQNNGGLGWVAEFVGIQ